VSKTLLLFLFTWFTVGVYGCPVTFRVLDKASVGLADISIILTNKQNLGSSNAEGFLRTDLSSGTYHLQLTYRHNVLLDTSLRVDCGLHNAFNLVVAQPQAMQAIQEVEVLSKSVKEQLNLSPFAVEVIDLKQDYNKGGDVAEVINRASGVKLRTDGNIGSAVQINLAGLQGKAVRIFKDGIPIELYGHGFNLGTIPLNMLERVEIYKGAMPMQIASDALGGGINLISRQAYKNTLEASYEAASFATHRATLYGLWLADNKKWYAGTNSSFNYSKNNYKVHVPVYAAESGKAEYKDLRRFHDAVRSHYAEVFAGLQQRSWVDDLRLSLIQSAFYKEIQHDGIMNKVYGEAFSKERNYTSHLAYRKSFFEDRLRVNFMSSYSYFKTSFIDTATQRYGWDGHIIGRNLQAGEINLGNFQHIDYHFLSSRLATSYQLNPQHALDLSAFYYQQQRKGSDPMGAISALDKIDVLTEPATYRKHIVGLGLRSLWFNRQLESMLGVKHYSMHSNGYTTDNFSLGWRTSTAKQQLGYLAGLRWSNTDFLVKLSYEYANRLPEEAELFGDNIMTKENMALQPEKSHNINLNGQYTYDGDNHYLRLSSSLFYRKVKDIIFLQLDIPFNRYINYEEAKVKGLEFEAEYRPYNWFDIGFNATYQDLRRINIQELMFRNLEGSRLPNIPFLFGNVWLQKNFKDVVTKSDRLDVRWNGHYTHRFFLYAIPASQEPPLFGKVEQFQSSLVIPNDGRLGQFSHQLGLYYQFPDSKIALSLEGRNLSNVRLYDNFNIQKPGRSLHFKIVYQFF